MPKKKNKKKHKAKRPKGPRKNVWHWPVIVRFPLSIICTLLIWWGPLVLTFLLISHYSLLENVDSNIAFIACGILLFGWSHLSMKYIIHTKIEPYFNIQSRQNPYDELFKK